MPQDDHGFHHGISVSEVGTSVAYPPYTLVRLIEERERCLFWINQSDRLKGVPETSTLLP